MAAINMFDLCNAPSMGGIKRMKLATRDNSDNPLDFPLDIVLKNNDESIIMLSDNETGRTITLGSQDIQYRIVYPINASCIEEETTGKQGRFYNQKLAWEMPQLSLTTNNQLKSFLFTDSGEFAISNMVAFIEDMNDNYWIVGYSQPMVLDNFELQTGVNGEDNKYVVSYTCKSYSKIRQYELQ
jgi:hypothetical protein